MVSALPVPIIRLSTRPIQIAGTYKPQVLVHVHVHVMDVLFPIQLWTFRKERGELTHFNSNPLPEVQQANQR